MVLDELYQKTEDHMKKTLEMLVHELSGIRTGKASPALLDSLRISYYGNMVPVKQVASVAVPDPRSASRCFATEKPSSTKCGGKSFVLPACTTRRWGRPSVTFA